MQADGNQEKVRNTMEEAVQGPVCGTTVREGYVKVPPEVEGVEEPLLYSATLNAAECLVVCGFRDPNRISTFSFKFLLLDGGVPIVNKLNKRAAKLFATFDGFRLNISSGRVEARLNLANLPQPVS